MPELCLAVPWGLPTLAGSYRARNHVMDSLCFTAAFAVLGQGLNVRTESSLHKPICGYSNTSRNNRRTGCPLCYPGKFFSLPFTLEMNKFETCASDRLTLHNSRVHLIPILGLGRRDVEERPENGVTMSSPPELKATLTLPQTAFAMKANLPQNEPLRLKHWASLRLYEELRKARAGRPVYLLHDGPPYANGPIHLGHALNKGLKDFVVKSKTMAGFDAPYVPGYDCHGLPIEIKVEGKLGHKRAEMPASAILEACREYAQKYVDLQTSQFERIGCFGRWDKPYKTMARDYEARTLEAFYGFLENGFVYRGLKPVYWCIHDRTALAEAEVEYENHTSPSIYVRYKLTSDPAAIDAALAGREVYTIIWTTTPWTLPASMAVAFHPDFEYVALEHRRQTSYIVAAELAESVKAACKLSREPRELARFKGSQLERVTFQHPFLERSILGVLATYVTADTGTGAVHTAPFAWR